MANNVTFEMRKLQGDRLKKEMRVHNLDRFGLSDIIHRVPKMISQYCTGAQTIPDDVFERLAAAWDVREKYLRCLDDWRTDSDYYAAIRNAAPDDPLGAILSHLKFFKAVGLDVHPCIEIVPNVVDLFIFWRLYELLLTAETLQAISESVPDFLQDVNDPSNMIFYDECDFPPLVLRTLPEESKLLFDPKENKFFLSLRQWQAEITLSFDVRKGETVKRYSTAALDAFCEKFDALALCAIDNFLLSDG